MSVIESVHEDHGATFGERADRRIVEHYGRPERTHRAVRNGVGLLEFAYGVIVVEGGDRVEYVDNVVSNRVPTEDGQGCYALVLDPQGGIDVELYVYNAGERLLLFTQPEAAEPLAEEGARRCSFRTSTFGSRRTTMRSSGSTDHTPPRKSRACSTVPARPTDATPSSAGRWATRASPSSGPTRSPARRATR